MLLSLPHSFSKTFLMVSIVIYPSKKCSTMQVGHPFFIKYMFFPWLLKFLCSKYSWTSNIFLFLNNILFFSKFVKDLFVYISVIMQFFHFNRCKIYDFSKNSPISTKIFISVAFFAKKVFLSLWFMINDLIENLRVQLIWSRITSYWEIGPLSEAILIIAFYCRSYLHCFLYISSYNSMVSFLTSITLIFTFSLSSWRSTSSFLFISSNYSTDFLKFKLFSCKLLFYFWTSFSLLKEEASFNSYYFCLDRVWVCLSASISLSPFSLYIISILRSFYFLNAFICSLQFIISISNWDFNYLL